MTNRLPPSITGLPESEYGCLIDFLKEQPSYREMESRLIFGDNGQVEAQLEIVVPQIFAFRYRDYFVSCFGLSGRIYITCEKATPKVLVEHYRRIRERLYLLESYLGDFEKEVRIRCFAAQVSIRNEFKDRIRDNKRQIKTELKRMGVDVRPGSELSKLLRGDYLPDAD